MSFRTQCTKPLRGRGIQQCGSIPALRFGLAVRVQERLSADLGLIRVKAEREQLMQLIRNRTVGSETTRKLVRELDLAEARYQG